MATEVFYLLLTVYIVSLLGMSLGNEENFVPADNVCSCPNDVLTYTCMVVEGVATVWGGTAFDCPSGAIILLHSEFIPGNVSGTCNDGAIVGQSIGSVDNCYTSQLRVTLNAEMNNKTIQCQGSTVIGGVRLSVISAPALPPSNAFLAGIHQGNLTFNWTLVTSACPIIYQTAFDCGSCPSTTQATTVICSNLELTTEKISCTFMVRSITCLNLIGSQNNSIAVMLKVPDIPDVNVIPIYSAVTQNLSGISLNSTKEVAFNVTNSWAVSVEEYIISYYYHGLSDVRTSTKSLVDGAINEVSIDDCPPESSVIVNISAVSTLGVGPPSGPFNLGCNNTFVMIQYNQDTSTLLCKFLEKMESTNQSCSVTYGLCDGEVQQTTQGSNNDTIILTLTLQRNNLYCYIVTASSNSTTVMVEGTILNANSGFSPTIVIAVIVPLFAVILSVLVLLLITVMIYCVILKRKDKDSSAHSPLKLSEITNEEPQSDEEEQKRSWGCLISWRLNFQKVSNRHFEKHYVTRDTQLRKYIEEVLGKRYLRGCVFYEFYHEIESISEEQELIFVERKVNGNYYHSSVDCHTLSENGLIGEGIRRPPNNEYQVCIQCIGSGDRHIPRNSIILYEVRDKEQSYSTENLPLHRVISDQIQYTTLESDMKLGDFYKMNYMNSLNVGNIFLDLGDFLNKEGGAIIDVILMDKNSKEMFTGPKARCMVNRYYQHLLVAPTESSADKHHTSARNEVPNGNQNPDQGAVNSDENSVVNEVEHMTESEKGVFTSDEDSASACIDPDYQMNDEDRDLLRWTVFVLTNKLDVNVMLKRGNHILYQGRSDTLPKFIFLIVDEDNIQMCEFINKKLQKHGYRGTFQNGKAFCQFSKQRDLLYYKDVVHPSRLTVKSGKELQLPTRIEWFYNLCQEPGEGIDPPNKTVFIQSNSYGSKCLKKGERILYQIDEVEMHRL